MLRQQCSAAEANASADIGGGGAAQRAVGDAVGRKGCVVYEACAEAEERRAWRGSSGGMHERGRHDDGHQRRQTTSLHTPIDSPPAVAHTRHTIAIRTLFHHPTAAHAPHAPHAHHHHRRPMPMWGSREKQRSKRKTIQARQPTYTHSTTITSPPMRLSALPTTNHPRCFDC